MRDSRVVWVSIVLIALQVCLQNKVSTGEKENLYTDRLYNSEKPIEITEGKQETHKPLITAENQKIEEWEIISDSKVKLTKTSETKLWRETTAKLSYSNQKASSTQKIIIAPPAPIVVPEKFDSIDLWVHGPNKCRPAISIVLKDADGDKVTIPMQGGGANWAKQGWWSMAHGVVTGKITFPATFQAIVFDKLTSDDDTLYFDALSFYMDEKKPLMFTKERELPFPTTPDTILPTCYQKAYKNDTYLENGKYVFSYESQDCNLKYIYTPKTGGLDDIEVVYNGNYCFYPTKNGGIAANVNGISFSPEDDGIVPNLAQESFNANKGELLTQWRWLKEKQKLEFTIKLSIKGKSLIVEAIAANNNITAFKLGRSSGTTNPKLIAVPFFDSRWSTPKILYANGVFVSTLLDWYKTNSSWLQEGNGIENTKIVSVDSAIYAVGSAYLPKTNGERNTLCERLFISVSPDVTEVLPNIPNPPSQYGKVTAKLVNCTRMYPVLGKRSEIMDEINFWRKMKNYGMNHMFIRYHEEMWRTPLKSSNAYSQLNAGAAFCGDQGVIELVEGLKCCGYFVGLYDNYKMINPLNGYFDNDIVACFDASGIWEHANNGEFIVKTSKAIELESFYSPRLHKKFGSNAVYNDETTNRPPWGHVDFDCRAPGAGKLTTALYDYGQILLKEKEFFRGPVWSEGTSQYFWAGLSDTNYAQNNHPDAPTLVDFQLLKIHPLENDTGVDLSVHFEKNLDWKLATQIVYGNMGHLWDSGKIDGSIFHGRAKEINDIHSILKSYFMMQQLQGYYAMIPVDKIRYNDNGALVSTSNAIATGAYKNSQVYVKYANCLEVYVNRNQEKNWKVGLHNKEYILPPNGYVAFLPDEILEYSCLVDNQRVDYVEGRNYTYCDGREKKTDFGNIVASNSYLLKKDYKTTWLIPAPFKQVEVVTLKGYNNIKEILAYSENNEILSFPVKCNLTDEGLNLEIVQGAFKYEIK